MGPQLRRCVWAQPEARTAIRGCNELTLFGITANGGNFGGLFDGFLTDSVILLTGAWEHLRRTRRNRNVAWGSTDTIRGESEASSSGRLKRPGTGIRSARLPGTATHDFLDYLHREVINAGSREPPRTTSGITYTRKR